MSTTFALNLTRICTYTRRRTLKSTHAKTSLRIFHTSLNGWRPASPDYGLVSAALSSSETKTAQPHWSVSGSTRPACQTSGNYAIA